MAGPFRCSIVTPSEATFEGEVLYITFQAWDGQQGVMRQRAPLLTRLGIGPARLDLADGTTRWFLLGGGFAQMLQGELTLLTEEAIAGESITEAEAEAELRDANAKAVRGMEDREKAEQDQQRASAKLRLAQMVGAS